MRGVRELKCELEKRVLSELAVRFVLSEGFGFTVKTEYRNAIAPREFIPGRPFPSTGK